MKIVEKTIEDLCRLVQKKTENCKESYEVNELAELTKALSRSSTQSYGKKCTSGYKGRKSTQKKEDTAIANGWTRK